MCVGFVSPIPCAALDALSAAVHVGCLQNIACRRRPRSLTPSPLAHPAPPELPSTPGNARRCARPTASSSAAAAVTHAARRVDDTLARIATARLVLCVRLGDRDAALAAAEAAVRGGVAVVEVTMTVPDAPWVIRELSARCPAALVGAGTVLTVAQAEASAAAGARFALSPVTDAAVVRACAELGVLAVPGAGTVTEVYRAWADTGARLVKVFPVSACGGVGFVRALGGPLADIPLLPSSGIEICDAPDYLAEQNVVAIGASKQILLPDAVKRGDWGAITTAARAWVATTALASVPGGTSGTASVPRASALPLSSLFSGSVESSAHVRAVDVKVEDENSRTTNDAALRTSIVDGNCAPEAG
jgi:2-dehydro-3-deoxyphosphogluconate aldolase / (4S)-4-hydroxy-2-oxoglutarate aldolase